MKKFVAALLAVLLTAGVCAVSVVAEEPSESVTYDSLNLIFPTSNKNTDKDVTLLQPGDIVNFETKSKLIEVTYYADALSITYDNIKNLKWKDYVDSLGTVAEFAQSANKYKTFFYSNNYGSATAIQYSIPPLNSEEHTFIARDNGGFVWGTLPIDYCLKNENGSDAEFLGWVVGAIKNKSSSTTLDLYAYWDRTSTGDTTTETTKPETTTEPDDENKSDIMKTLGKLFSLFTDEGKYDEEDWRFYITFIPKLPVVLFGALFTLLTNGKLLSSVYDYLGIKVD